MDAPGSPTGSVMSDAGEKKMKLPPAVAKAGKEELQKMLMDTLKKLRIRDKKLTDAASALKQKDSEIQQLKEGSGEPSGASAEELADVKRQLAEAHEAASQQRDSDREDAKALAKSTQEALLAAQGRAEELETALRDAEATATEARADAEASREQISALEQQVASFKVAVDSMAGDANARSEGLQRELSECKSELEASAGELEALRAELEAAKDEASSAGEAYERLADAKDQVRCMEEALHESNEQNRNKVAELEAALAEVRAEHAQLEASQKAAAELTSDREAAQALVAELEGSLATAKAENARLAEALQAAEVAAKASTAEDGAAPGEASKRIAALEAQIQSLQDENERLVESEAQTSEALAAVRQKYEDQERMCAQFAVMETSMEASVEAMEQRAEDAEERLQVLSSRMEQGSNNLLAALAAFEKRESKAFSSSLATVSLLDAHLNTDGADARTAVELPADQEAASLKTQLSVLQDTLDKEIQARTEAERDLVRAQGQLEGAIAAAEKTPSGKMSPQRSASAAAAAAGSLSPILANSDDALGDCGTPELQMRAQHLSAEAEAKLSETLRELEALRAQLEAAQEEATEQRAEAEALSAKLEAFEAGGAAQAELQAELGGLQARVQSLENEKASVEATAEELRKKLAVSHADLAEAAAASVEGGRAVAEELQAVNEKLAGLQQELEMSHGKEEALRIELEEKCKELEAQADANRELEADAQRRADAAAAEAATSSESTVARVEELEGALAAREKELADSKKKFLSVAKKKQAEYLAKSKEDKAKIEELESLADSHQRRAAEAEGSLEEARGQVRIREKELARLKEDLGLMETEASNAKMHSSGAVEQLRKELSAKEYEATAAKKDLEEAKDASQQMEKQLDAARAKAREEREALTARLEEEVERLEKSHSAAVAEMKAELQSEHESDMEHLRETHKVAVERLKASLEAAEKEATEANRAAIKAEAALEEAGSSAKDASAAAEQHKGQLAKELEAAKAQIEAAKKEHEAEREKMKKAVADYKKKADRAERTQRKAEVQAAEMRGKAEAEKEVLRSEAAAAGTQVALAKEEVARVEGELKEYRQRAHALLQRKEEELRKQLGGLSDGTAEADGLQQAAREAQEMLKQAREERDQMARSLEDAEERWAAEADELRAAAEDQREALRRELAAARQQASRSAADAQDLRARCAALEGELAKGRAAEALEGDGGLGNAAKAAAAPALQQVDVFEQPQAGADHQAALEALRAEFEAFRETSMQMAEAKDLEVGKLLEVNARLKEQLREAREQSAAEGLRAAVRRASSTGNGEPAEATNEAADEGDILQRLATAHFAGDWMAEDEVRPSEEWDGWARGLGEGGGSSLATGEQAVEASAEDLAAGFGSQNQRDEASLLEEMLGKGGLGAVMGDQAQLFKIAERQALRDEELNSVHRRAAELEEELLELRREVELREEQDRVLKDALRETEAQYARREAAKSDFDMEYLKNVVIQFVCTRQQEALLPVVAEVLHLSPSEVQKCSSAMKRYKEEEEPDIVNAATDYLSSTASWLGSGWLGTTTPSEPAAAAPEAK